MEGNEGPEPLLSGQNATFKVEEILRLLNNTKEKIATTAVKKPQGRSNSWSFLSFWLQDITKIYFSDLQLKSVKKSPFWSDIKI